MEAEKPKASPEKLAKVVQAYCCIDQQWLGDGEIYPLVEEMAKAWSGFFLDTFRLVFSRTQVKSAKYGQLVEIVSLPYAAGLEDSPEIVKELCAKYGYALLIAGAWRPGIEIYFVARNVMDLNSALKKFGETVHVRL
ncbi:hypothetical protein [Pseudomonas fluorescens group sp. PF-69]